MLDLDHYTPEERFAITREHQNDYMRLVDISDTTVGAFAAQWAADMCALEEHLWERYIVASVDNDKEFARINDFVAQGLEQFTAHTGDVDCSAVLRRGRVTISDMFAEVTMFDDWTVKCSTSARFAGVPVPTTTDWETIRDIHTHRRTVAETLQHHHRVLERRSLNLLANRPSYADTDAYRQVWDLDWLAFHTHLLEVSTRCGDTYLVAADLRWRLAVMKMGDATTLPAVLHDATHLWRNIMFAVVGPGEATQLGERFLPF